MILNFSMENFGPINEKVTLSFEPTKDETLSEYYVTEVGGERILKLAMIYGPNASGKSTILHGLQLLRVLVTDPNEQKTDPIDYQRFQLEEATKKRPTRFELTFYVNQVKYDYQVEFDNEQILFEELTFYPHQRAARVYKRSTDISEGVSRIEVGSTIDLKKDQLMKLEGNTIKNNTVLGGYSKSNISHQVLDDVYKWFQNQLLPIITPSHRLYDWTTKSLEEERLKKGQFLDMLKKADLQISDFELIENQIDLNDRILNTLELLPIPDEEKDELSRKKKVSTTDVVFTHEFRGEDGKKRSMQLDVKWESSGTMRYYGLAGPVLSGINNDNVIYIDELETSLHPDLMKHLILTFLANSKQAQLIFTTHNISFFAEREVLRNDTIWFTEKNRNGATNLYSASDFKSSELRKTSSIFNAYKIGKLGAKPKTSGIYLEDV